MTISNLFILFFALTCGVIFVNGWTDAPNAIATCIATRSLSPMSAVFLSAVFNFLGVWFITSVNASVAMTMKNMVDFGTDTKAACYALCAALFSIILWSVAAWYFGIPTSESHSLIAGLSGAAIALQGGLSGIRFEEWQKVLYGFLLSVFLGFFCGFFCTRLVETLFFNRNRLKLVPFFKYAQIFGGISMSFMHGAQDGQKFIGILLLGFSLLQRPGAGGPQTIPMWMILLCSFLISLGTSLGGGRIIKSVGMDMVRLTPHQGFCADLGAAFSLLLASLWGIPVSTTHTKTTAIMGAGASHSLRAVRFSVVKELLLTWILTFPGCCLIAYITVKLILL